MDVKMVNKKTHALTFNSIPLITDCLRKGKRKKICVGSSRTLMMKVVEYVLYELFINIQHLVTESGCLKT